MSDVNGGQAIVNIDEEKLTLGLLKMTIEQSQTTGLEVMLAVKSKAFDRPMLLKQEQIRDIVARLTAAGAKDDSGIDIGRSEDTKRKMN